MICKWTSEAPRDLVRVQSLEDFAWFLKESEMVAGHPGREFLVAGGSRSAYQVRLDLGGYEIRRIDGAGHMDAPVLAAPGELLEHDLGAGIASGVVYTTALQ